MKICFVAWRDLDHPEAGGSELFVHRIGQELVRRGHHVTLLCARWPGSAAEEIVDGIHVVRRGGRISVYPRAAAHLFGHRGRGHDVIIDVINGLPFGVALWRRRTSLALIHHVHHDQWKLLYPGVVGKLGWAVESRVVPLLYRRRSVVTVSEQSRRDLLSLGHRDVFVVRNGVDQSDAIRQRAGSRLVVVARLVPHKQVDWAIDAVAELSETITDVRLDVVGDGYLADALRRHAVDRGVADRVVFHGHLANRDRDRVLAAAAAVVLPSIKEGWGLALVEGAVIGVPGVALRVAGGVTEAVLDDQTGLIVDDFAGLVDACRRLLTDSELNQRLGDQARKRAATLAWSDAASELERRIAH